MRMPTLETDRLLVRPFNPEDLTPVHQILDVELGDADFGYEGTKALDERESWLRWTMTSYEELAKLCQPPYGDRAVVLKQTGRLVGVCGYVPCLGPFERVLAPRAQVEGSRALDYTTEVGLYYAFSPAVQRQGCATEAARALVDYAFRRLKLKRVVATTTHDNAASVRVMEKLGMRVERDTRSAPPWFQVVGVLERV